MTRAAPLVTGTFGHFEIIRPLGQGAMGEVYLAQDVRLVRPVALKLLPTEFQHDIERLGRFQREARAAAALNHPNIVTVHDVGEYQGRPFIATEFVEGETLAERLRRGDGHVQAATSTRCRRGRSRCCLEKRGGFEIGSYLIVTTC